MPQPADLRATLWVVAPGGSCFPLPVHVLEAEGNLTIFGKLGVSLCGTSLRTKRVRESGLQRELLSV